MRVLVTFKRTVDYHLTPRPNAAGTGVELAGLKMAPNPFDEIALEEAIRLKEAGIATEVVAVALGDASSQETLRTALAIGADRAIHVLTQGELSGLQVADVLKTIVLKEQATLVLMGKQAIDTDAGQVPSMLAELLGWPQANNAFKVTIANGCATVACEADRGAETIEFTLPGLITTDLRLNTPRLVAMPQIIKARTKPLTTETIECKLALGYTRTQVFVPQQTRQNKILPDATSLVAVLKELTA